MNSIRSALIKFNMIPSTTIIKSSRPTTIIKSSRPMSYIGNFNNIRYGCVKIVDYSGYNYIIPYTCKLYTDDIDDLIITIVCDIPPQDYHVSSHIVETMVNQQLTRAYGLFYDVKLMPPAKNMLPPCGPMA